MVEVSRGHPELYSCTTTVAVMACCHPIEPACMDAEFGMCAVMCLCDYLEILHDCNCNI